MITGRAYHRARPGDGLSYQRPTTGDPRVRIADRAGRWRDDLHARPAEIAAARSTGRRC
jgi:hypothetical protein